MLVSAKVMTKFSHDRILVRFQDWAMEKKAQYLGSNVKETTMQIFE